MWKKIVFGNFILAAFIINIVSIVGILLIQKFLPPIVPLFYGKPRGVTQLIEPLGLLIVPFASLVITIINLLLNLWAKDLFLKKILAFAALTVSVIGLITVIRIYLLVGFY